MVSGSLLLELTLHQLVIPFSVKFSHASASRTQTSSLWVEARSKQGIVGYGESCPRDYVTGESIQSGQAFFYQHRPSILGHIDDVVSMAEWMNEHKREIDRHPAAWCAIELALLDLIAKTSGQSIEAVLAVPQLRGTFRYSAVLGNASPSVFGAQFTKYRELGFSDFKLKLSGNLEEDGLKVSVLRGAEESSIRVRIDANNLWRTASEAIDYIKRLDYSFFAVEEPLPPNQYDELANIADTLGVKIILDESFLRAEQLGVLSRRPDIWIVNLRVSKMGGLLRSLTIVERARAHGIPLIIGAQVGESSLLTRAALTVANAARDILIAQEGAFGTRLLESDVCSPSIMFGYGGTLTIADFIAPDAVGFGVAVNAELPFRIALPA